MNSMVSPAESTVGPIARDLHVSFVNPSGPVGTAELTANALIQNGRVPLNPAPDGDVVDGESALGHYLLQIPVAQRISQIQTCGFTTTTLAITLEALAEDTAARQRAIDQIQLVWTSPDEEGPHVRDTSVVVGQLLSEARQSLWMSTYSIFNGHEVFLPIEEAWTCRPELEVVLILNVPPSEEAAVEKYAWSFWKYHWPWTSKPAVFYDPRGPEKAPASPACQHAKCILVDGVTAFITSANFTESAHERNIEFGVLFRENPKLAQSIRSKFESLIQNGFLKPLPKC